LRRTPCGLERADQRGACRDRAVAPAAISLLFMYNIMYYYQHYDIKEYIYSGPRPGAALLMLAPPASA
jgi:hypothetical protein